MKTQEKAASSWQGSEPKPFDRKRIDWLRNEITKLDIAEASVVSAKKRDDEEWERRAKRAQAAWATDASVDAHVGMLGVNADKAKALQTSLVRNGFEYRFPAQPPTSEMVQHAFVRRNEGGENEWRMLNERKNGFHNITGGTVRRAKDVATGPGTAVQAAADKVRRRYVALETARESAKKVSDYRTEQQAYEDAKKDFHKIAGVSWLDRAKVMDVAPVGETAENKLKLASESEADIATEYGDGTKFKKGDTVLHNHKKGTYRKATDETFRVFDSGEVIDVTNEVKPVAYVSKTPEGKTVVTSKAKDVKPVGDAGTVDPNRYKRGALPGPDAPKFRMEANGSRAIVIGGLGDSRAQAIKIVKEQARAYGSAITLRLMEGGKEIFTTKGEAGKAKDSSNKALAPIAKVIPRSKRPKAEDALTVGAKVHLGFGTKGGAGFTGVITKIEGDTVFVKNDEGRTFKGSVSKVSAADKEPSPFDVDTDVGASKIVKREGKTMTAAEIARKYNFSLSFVKEVLGGDNTKHGHPVGDAGKCDYCGKSPCVCKCPHGKNPETCKTCKKEGWGDPYAKDVAPVGDSSAGALSTEEIKAREAAKKKAMAELYYPDDGSANSRAVKAWKQEIAAINTGKHTGDIKALQSRIKQVIATRYVYGRLEDVAQVGDAENLPRCKGCGCALFGKSETCHTCTQRAKTKDSVSAAEKELAQMEALPRAQKKLQSNKWHDRYQQLKMKVENERTAARKVGDAGMINVSYKLNGPTVFQVDNSQFVEWARKNKKDIGNFTARLTALKEFTGDPRLKDWDTE